MLLNPPKKKKKKRLDLLIPNGAFVGIVDSKTALPKAKESNLDPICTTVKADPPM